jgi:hypothetical protein
MLGVSTPKMLLMKISYKFLLLSAFVFLVFTQCSNRNVAPTKIYGYKPVYSNSPDLFAIAAMPAAAVVNAGKIYVSGNYIFQVEDGEGIHVVDKTSAANAQRVAFIKVKGCKEVAVKNGFIITNNYADLVTLKMASPTSISEVKRIKNAFSNGLYNNAPPGNGYFECADASKGVVIGWLQDTIYSPKCFK